MKHSIVVKFLVILLTACSLVAAIGGGVGIVGMESSGLYVNGIEVLQDQEYDSIANAIAESLTNRYAAENLSNLSYAMREELYPDPEDRGDAAHWSAELRQGEQVLIAPKGTDGYTVVKEFSLAPVYPVVSLYGPDEGIPDASGAEEEEGSHSAYETLAPEGYLYHRSDTVWEAGGFTTYHYYYYEAPEYSVTVYMQPRVLESSALHMLTVMYPHRYSFIVVLAMGLLSFAAGMVYLIWAAGRHSDGTVRPGGLNRLPLDLYALFAAGGIIGLSLLLTELIDWMEYEGPHPGNLSILAVNLLGIILLGMGFVYAFSAQIKVKGFWWQHSLLGWCCRGLKRLFLALGRFFRLLPVMWQWIVTAGVLAIALVFCVLLTDQGTVLPLLLVVLTGILVVCRSAYAYGSLLSGARKMAQGDLTHKISTRFLMGPFRECAEHLNELADVATVAAQKQMKSERMKTELITNVSHDIKTPLTSIISYVDLLEKPHSPQEAEQYLEVLGRQSQRMKKLIEDLMELSKASSGNMAVEITQVEAAEAVNQALGEFADKLAAANLEPVFQQPEGTVAMLADGRLTWRVLSNLLSNTVKYAMPGTRVYLDLMKLEDRVLISVKNVSREPLNVSADELTERFVRGDASRNTEGSGLGLNIAKSLMELQNGQLHLLIDGDFFKVTLIFPAG